MFSQSISASSKAEWVVKYIIAHSPVSLPDLRKLKINWEYMACISTHISDGRNKARKLWYEIKPTITHRKRSLDVIYYAIPHETP